MLVRETDGGLPACELPGFTGGVSTLGGCGVSGAADGPRGTAQLANPVNVAAAPNGDVYVADFDNDRVRVISPDGEVRTIVAQPLFQKPFGLAVTADGELSDYMHHTVRLLDPDDGVVTPLAAGLDMPMGAAVLPDGRIAVADLGNGAVKAIALDGTIETLATGLGHPQGVTVDAAGAIYVTETDGYVVKRLDADGATLWIADGTRGEDVPYHRVRVVAL